MKKVLVIVILFLLAFMLNSCKKADINPHAACLKLNFSDPESYPFLKKTNLTNSYYYEINNDIATIDCYIYNPIEKKWNALQGYQVYYDLTGDLFPMVERLEEYTDNKIYHDEKKVILPANLKKAKLKFIANSTNNLFQPHYHNCDIDLSSSFIIKDHAKIILFWDYSVYWPCYNINLPTWKDWKIMR